MAPAERGPRPIEPLFPPVTGGLKGLTPELVAQHQRTRLMGAMIDAVARHGYAGTTLRELVRVAGVSKSTFYDHFESKQEAFLATSDEIVARVGEQVRNAYQTEGDYRERLLAALATLMELVASEPQAATLATVETATLGKAGVEHRERSSGVLEEVVSDSFARSPAEVEVPVVIVRAIATGIRGVVYRHLRCGTSGELPDLVEELTDWALSYQRPEDEIVARAVSAASEPSAVATKGAREELAWDEPPDSQRSRAALTQRERIVRAVGRLVVERGYETLSIPAISATAGTSNQTFYEHFDNKRDAFLEAFDVSAADGLHATSEAFAAAGGGPEAIGAGLRTMLEYIAGNELFARLSFFDLQAAGPPALDRAATVMESFSAFLRPGLAPPEIDAAASDATLQAISSGTWSVIQYELAHGKAGSLPRLAPDVARIVLMPLTSSRPPAPCSR
jgi:AcrR family transcriptional regulator